MPDKRPAWLGQLGTVQTKIAEQAPAFAAFLAACTALIAADGEPASLGENLTPFSAGIWAQVVAALAPRAAGRDDGGPAEPG